MKLVVMIPAYNEEANIGKVIREIKQTIESTVIVLNDGSTDNTLKEAKKAGADYIFSNKRNLGLARTFKIGLEKALELEADIIVNTDADFQYDQKEIPRIIKPIIENKADIVLTDRNVKNLKHMPTGKRYGNMLSTFIASLIAGYNIKDAQSGFRAFSRESALRLNILSDYTYVQETIIQAVDKKLKIVQLPCKFKKREGGKSRLISNIGTYAWRAGSFMLRSYIRYKPLKSFVILGTIPFTLGLILAIRFIIFFINGIGSGHLQSLILAAILIIVGFQIAILGLIADTISTNRRIEEEILYKLKKSCIKD